MKFGFLSTIDQPLLPYYIFFAIKNHCEELFIICDSKLLSQKDKILWNKRVGNVFYSMFKNKKTLFNIQKFKIPFYFVNNHNDKDCIDLINNLQIDCLFNAGTQRKLSSNILKSVKKGVINIHPGILPEYRGCTCVEWAILNDEKVGNTAHFMTEGYDEGPIIKIECYEFPMNML